MREEGYQYNYFFISSHLERVENAVISIPHFANTCSLMASYSQISFKNKKVNKTLIIFILLINSFFYSQSKNEIYPTNIDGEIVNKFDSLNKINRLNQVEGKFYAFNAKVLEVKKAYNKKPYLLIEFPEGQKIWVASLLNDKLLKKNAQLKILGILSKVQENDEIAKKLNDKNYHILMFAFLDIISFEAKAFEGALDQAEQWRDGQIPEKLD